MRYILTLILFICLTTVCFAHNPYHHTMPPIPTGGPWYAPPRVLIPNYIPYRNPYNYQYYEPRYNAPLFRPDGTQIHRYYSVPGGMNYHFELYDPFVLRNIG